jgi:hypothetical protein
MSGVKFLADENVAAPVVHSLREAEIDVSMYLNLAGE